ncbi:uncharacterized protein BDZ83DRAFT_426321 [Colletotrichum acutatum]|uniref:Uncharacterized protein n=1 Tax=Glomerella acutata TaxID=27357 RepID=A0AAD8XML6_GLOAC|nr:uncharacterized protein BDZ83DRAFT_426321 [Colletotrichum acutatum]KAK1730170.1 hypothetical protein BDZ83DRAFT_426321 [Colletotrichum acutatum]
MYVCGSAPSGIKFQVGEMVAWLSVKVSGQRSPLPFVEHTCSGQSSSPSPSTKSFKSTDKSRRAAEQSLLREPQAPFILRIRMASRVVCWPMASFCRPSPYFRRKTQGITHRRCSYLPGHTVTSHRTTAPDIQTPVGDLSGQTLHTNGRPRGVLIGRRSCGIRRRVMECEFVTAPTFAEASRMPSGTATMGTSSTTGVPTKTTHSRRPRLRLRLPVNKCLVTIVRWLETSLVNNSVASARLS